MTASPESIERTIIAARAASDVKATSILALDVTSRLPFADVFLILSGSTGRQVRAIVDAVEHELHEAGVHRVRREGFEGDAHWVIVDFGGLMVHVQQDEDREFYALDKLWGDCPEIELPEDVVAEPAQESNLADYFTWDGE